MFRKIIEEKRKINALNQKCFDARAKLIVVNSANENVVGCIELKYSLEQGIIDAWRIGMEPEKTYRVIGPRISYCPWFNPGNPTRNECNRVSCPRYEKYREYLRACKQLQKAKSK